ncbi:hypothetical protein PMAYCL1PPCAC_05127, partial [Pristionchus mayeri]
LLSFGLLLSATVEFLIYRLPTNDFRWEVLNRRWIVTDFVSLFPPWSLLLLSSAVRAEIYNILLHNLSPPSRSSTGITMRNSFV